MANENDVAHITSIVPNAKELARLAKDWLTFERLRQELLNQGAPDPLIVCATNRDVEQAVTALLSATRSQEEIERTYVAVANSLSGHPEFARLRYASEKPMANLAPGALQAMLQARDDVFSRPHIFQEGMRRICVTVCQIVIAGQAMGTGFLISDRHVLTAYHCVKGLIVNGKQKPNSSQVLSIVFDNVVIPGQKMSSYRAEFGVASQWLVDHSENDPDEDTNATPLVNVKAGLLDFALICLDEPAGNMAPKWQPSRPRSWIDIDKLAPAPSAQAQMLITHYPGNSDLRFCVGLFGDHANKALRVRYQTPTVVGSSGAPCFTVGWEPYALHNAGYPTVPINQGVPLELIRELIGGSAKLSATKKSETRILPAATPTGAAILDRQAIAQQIVSILDGDSPVRAIIITSAAQGGKTFTGELIRSMLIDRGQGAFLFDVEKFISDTPERFAKRLVDEIVGTDRGTPQPPSPDNRQRARWISNSLAEWTWARVLSDIQSPDQTADKSDKTLWMILDRCDTNMFSAETHDLLVALIGNEDVGDHILRFVLLGYGGALGSVPPQKVWRTDLDLISAAGVLPFMEHTLDTLSIEEDPITLKFSAEEWVATAANFGITTIPPLIIGLDGWAKRRGTKGRVN